MSLTRTRFIQSNTILAKIDDPITAINSGSTIANVDVGFIFNRNQGIKSNVAVYWNEAGQEFTLALTSDTGVARSNITLTSYANIRANAIFANIGGGTTTSDTFITGNFLPSANVTYDLGSSSKRFKDLWLSGSTIYMGSESLSVTTDGEWVFTSGGTTTKIGSTSIFKDMTVTGNLTVQGNAFIVDTINTTVYDSMIDIHTYGNLDPLLSDDGRDVGIKLHYYKTQNSVGFLGWKNDTGNLEWYATGSEGAGNVFTGTYGTIKTGELVLANTTAATDTSSGALRVAGGASVAGALYINNTGDVSANIGTLFLGNISTNANLGAYQLYANANAAAQTVAIDSLALGANANTAAYLLTATGNISAGNITTSGNIYTQRVYSDGVFWSSNGQPFGSVTTAGQDGDLQYKSGSTLAAAKIRQDAGTGNLTITTTTSSESISTGALVIKGGLGVTGNIFAGGLNGQLYGTLNLGTTAVDYNRSSGGQYLTGVAIEGTADTAKVAIASQITSNISSGTGYLTFVDTTNGNAALNIGPSLQYNPSQGRLSAYALTITNTGDVSANIGTIKTDLQALTANLGSFDTYANANAAIQSIAIASLASGANTNTAAFLTTYTGNIQAGNINIISNLIVGSGSSGNISGVNYLVANNIVVNANVDMTSGYITNLADPLASQDAATKNYVDSQLSGFSTTTISAGSAYVTAVDDGGFGNVEVSGNLMVDVIRFANGAPYSTGISGITVSEINTANALSNISTGVTAIRFDRDTGMYVNELSPGNVRISLGSTFKTWHVPGQADLVAIAEDEVTFFGNGIDITTNPVFPKAITFISNNSILEANIGSFYTYANANIGTLYLGNVSTQANIGSIYNQLNTLDANVGAYEIYANANAAAQAISIDSINANLGAYQTYANANIGTLYLGNISTQANIGSIYNQLNTLDANVGAFELYANANIGTLYLGNISTQANLGAFQAYANTTFATGGSTSDISANLGAYQLYANANVGSIYNQLNTLDANVGAFELYANANIGTLHLGNISTQANIGTIKLNLETLDANVGAFELYANANIGTIKTNLYTLDANVGAYQLYANANATTQAISLDTINANIGAFYTYANSKIGTNTNSNLVITSSTDSVSAITGALVVKGGVGIGGNLYVTGNIYASNLTAISISTLSVTDPLLYLTASNPFPYNYDIGFFSHYSRVSGDERHTGLARDYTTDTWNFFSNIDANPGATIDWTEANIVYDTVKLGDLIVSNTTQSTSATTGALRVAGGAGVAGSLFVGSYANVLTSGAGTISIGGPALTNGIYYDSTNPFRIDIKSTSAVIATQNPIYIESSAIATSTSSGALKVSGGAGIAGALWIANTGDVSANIGSIRVNLDTLDANVGAFQLYANANIGAFQTFSNANASTQTTSINSINANLGAYQTYANANASTQATSINSINANLGAYQTYANANASTQATSIDVINANLGAFQTFSNANAATQATSINTINANLGAYQLYANANIGTLFLGNASTNANLGAYQTWANANLGTTYSNANVVANLQNFVTTINSTANIITTANIYASNIITSGTTGNISGVSFIFATNYVYPNGVSILDSISGSGAYSNANVTAYLPIHSGNISAGNIAVTSNITAGNIRVTSNISGVNYMFASNYVYPNGVSILTGIGGTYSNANVAAYLPTYTGNISAGNVAITSNLSVGNIVATGLTTTGATGNISGVSYIFATNYVYPNGVSILDGISGGGGGSYGNTQVAAYLPIHTGNIAAGNVFVTSNISAGNITTLGITTTGSSGNITGVNYVFATNYVYTNGVSILTGIGGTYSNANVTAYLPIDTTITTIQANIGTLFLGNARTNANLGAYQIWANANFGTSSYSNANVVANLQNFVTTISTTANIVTTANVISPRFLFANGVSILSLAPGLYSNTNVAAYLPTHTGNISAGNITVTSNITASNVVTVSFATLGASGNISGVNYMFANIFMYPNGVSILDGISGSGTYSNANVNAFIGANIGTLYNSNIAVNANLGAFQLYANTKIGTNTNSNLVVVATTDSTSTTTGALVVGGGAGIAGNVYTDKMFTTSGIYWAGNGAPWMAQFTASATAPSTPSLGSYWYKTTTDVVYEYVYDGANSFWLDIFTAPFAANIVTSTYIGDTYAGNITFTGTITGSVGYLLERANVVASAPPAVTNLDLITSPIAYFTSNSTQNITANIRGNSNTPLNNMMTIGQSATFVIFMPNATAYYINAIKIDNVTITPFWQGGSSVINGNANSLDVYTFAVLKTANATFKVFASQVRYQNLGP